MCFQTSTSSRALFFYCLSWIEYLVTIVEKTWKLISSAKNSKYNVKLELTLCGGFAIVCISLVIICYAQICLSLSKSNQVIFAFVKLLQ